MGVRNVFSTEKIGNIQDILINRNLPDAFLKKKKIVNFVACILSIQLQPET